MVDLLWLLLFMAILIWMYYHGPRHTDEHHHHDSLPHPQQATDDSSHESDSNSNEGTHHLLVSGAGDGPPLCSQNLGAPGGGPDNGPQDPDNTDDNGPQDPDNTCPLGGLVLLLLMSKYYTLCPPPPFPYASFSNALSPLSPVILLLSALWNLHGQALYLGILLFIFACLLGKI